ncbi:hypothetical protein S40293_09483 [Stachybotrys chartarum IBT 40293]|nr:hypothetical protein S40293_09483 [Stachybotrys chartarum IBT 40293]
MNAELEREIAMSPSHDESDVVIAVQDPQWETHGWPSLDFCVTVHTTPESPSAIRAVVMKGPLMLAVLAAPLAQCHYIFSQLIVNGQAVGGDYTYMRRNTNSYMPSFAADVINSPNLRCNEGATTGTAQTYTVAAGSRIGFKLWYNEFIEHPGPGFVYMSRAPGALNSYDGSGDWFKVYESGLCGSNPSVDNNWCTWQDDRIEFTIPNRIPPGDYLVRVEHIAIHEGHVGRAQFYMECAHLRITGSGGGTPGPLVRIPGLYRTSDPGIAYNKWTSNPAPYVMPGPAVWVDNGSSNPTNPTPTNPTNPGTGAPLYGQCGGQGWTGPTTCAQGTCTVSNQWYSQCL